MKRQPLVQTAREGRHTPPRRGSTQGLSILLAEDTPANQKLFREILVRRGHRVQVVANGRDAVREVERQQFDVVLLDLQLPVLNGLRAAAAIRSSTSDHSDVPIVAMTAHAMRGDRDRCLAAGMNAYIAKPVDAAELVRVVEQLAGAAGNSTTTGDARPVQPVIDGSPSTVPATAPSADGSLIDLASARQRMGGNEELLRDMARFLIEDSPALLQELMEAVAAGDPERSTRAAHSLRGLAVNFGAARCLSVATQIEADCRDGIFEPVKRDLASLRREFQSLISAVQREVLC